MARYDTGQILIWRNTSVSPTKTIVTNLSSSWSLFVTGDEEIFVDGGYANNRVDRLTSNGTRLPSPMSVCSECSGLFVDTMNNLYCSQDGRHQVVRRSLLDQSNAMTIAAGTGSSGSASDTLNGPHGIFVTNSFDLYVADFYNDRVQLFRSGETNGTTVTGNGSIGTIALRHPTGIVLDADGYLFIVDSGSHRIVGSGPDGFRCVVGCSGTSGTPLNRLTNPFTMGFDHSGNIFVTDRNNSRLQKFLLSNNSCGMGWRRAT